jgi:hypothetical protein
MMTSDMMALLRMRKSINQLISLAMTELANSAAMTWPAIS